MANPPPQLTAGHLAFTLALHRELPLTGNLCWSPYSVAAALGLAAAGARGATYDELARVLAPGGELAALARLLADAASPPDAEAAVANTLWLDRQVPCHQSYQERVLSQPGGGVRTADFRYDPEGARSTINEDVAGTTRGLIRDLLAPGVIHPQVAAVIVNALYLKVAWQVAFEAAATRPVPFHAPTGSRPVPTMRQQESLAHATADGWRLATLPTASTVAVDLLLPPAGTAAGAAPDPELLAALHAAARPTKVDLAVPRFRVEAGATLNEYLRRLGVVTAFTDAADFSGISPRSIAIDSVVHKAVLRVDEQGFEGAAATAVVMRLVSIDMSTPVPFHVDRPFLVLVRHLRTGAIYFLARVEEP